MYVSCVLMNLHTVQEITLLPRQRHTHFPLPHTLSVTFIDSLTHFWNYLCIGKSLLGKSITLWKAEAGIRI
jgi:hypothetical protein